MTVRSENQREIRGLITWSWRLLRAHPQRVVLSLLIAVGFVWLFRRGGLPLVPPAAAFEAQRWWALPAYAAIAFAANFFRTYRWIYLLRPIAPQLSRWRVLGIGYVGFTAVQIAPLRMGEVVRPYLISQDQEVTFVQAAGTVGAERTIDGLVLTLLSFITLTLSTPLSPLPDRLGDLPLPVKAVPGALYLALLAFTAAFVLMAVFYWAREAARRLTLRAVGLISKRLATLLTSVVERLAESLRFLPSTRHVAAFLRDTLIYWGLGVCGQWLLLRGLGIPATLVEAGVTLGVMGIGTLIPSGPGFFGAYQISAYAGLALFYPESVLLSAGAGFVFLSYTTQITVNVLCSVVGFSLMARFPPRFQERESSALSA
ncbi:MAG TPA: lysylphosphatidylglycerol synthase transmembrane domain-containing protein [Polyangiaceae bacterium]